MKLLTEIVVIVAGVFLIIDGMFIHAVSFDYNKYGMAWLDPYFSHTLLGAILLVAAFLDLRASKKR